MSLQVVRQVENGLCQYAPLTEEERDQEPPDAAVAVKKRVNGLELGVGQPNLHQQRQSGIVVQKSLQG